MGTRPLNRGLLKEFNSNISSIFTPTTLTFSPTLLTTVTLNTADAMDRVWLTGRVEFRVIRNAPATIAFAGVEIEIFRNDPTFTTVPIFTTNDSGLNSDTGISNFTTGFSHVDTTPPNQVNTYYLTARRLNSDPALAGVEVPLGVAGGASLTGAVIKPNNPLT